MLHVAAAVAGFVMAVAGIAVLSWPLALVAGGVVLLLWGLFTEGGD